MTTYCPHGAHDAAERTKRADPRVVAALAPCTCAVDWTDRGLSSPDCALCQHGDTVLDALKAERRRALEDACRTVCASCNLDDWPVERIERTNVTTGKTTHEWEHVCPDNVGDDEDDEPPEWCAATEIRDLIAAEEELDEE
jgi:hypothetical protein